MREFLCCILVHPIYMIQRWAYNHTSYHNEHRWKDDNANHVRLMFYSHLLLWTHLNCRSTMTSTGTSTGTSTSTTRTRTTSDAQGPVAAPAPTTGTPGAPTPYTYTTVVNGVTTVLSDIFTPTSPATVSFSPSAVGTEWAYSSWLSIYGPPKTAKSSATRSIVPSSPFLIGVAVFVFHWPRLRNW